MKSLFRRQVALPQEHGSWAFFLGPLIIGLFVGGRWHTTVIYLTVAHFLGHDPVDHAVLKTEA